MNVCIGFLFGLYGRLVWWTVQQFFDLNVQLTNPSPQPSPPKRPEEEREQLAG
jgi:hypothetical protein